MSLPRASLGESARKERARSLPGRTRERVGATRAVSAPPLDDVATTPVSALPGAGPVTTARLVAAGLGTVGDILAFVPRAYDDLRWVTPLSALSGKPEGSVVLVRGTVARVNVLSTPLSWRFISRTVSTS